jgi:hypothetical protein
MDGHISAPVLSRLDRANLGLGELRGFDRIVRRGDASAGHQLDLAGAMPQLLPGSQPHFMTVMFWVVPESMGVVDIRLIVFPLTNTLEGGESMVFLPSKTRTFRKSVVPCAAGCWFRRLAGG